MTSAAAEHAVFPKDRQVVVSDGTPIAYSDLPGDGQPILLVNGLTCPDCYWAGIAPTLHAAGHRLLVPDTRGHGQSGLPRAPGCAARRLRPEDTAVDRLARDLIEVLDDAGVDRAVVMGHSLGVQILFEAYRIAPDRVAGLVPVAGTYENPVLSFAGVDGLDRLFPIAEVLFRRIPFEWLKPVLARTASPELGHRVIRAIRAAGPTVEPADLAPHVAQIHELDFSVMWRVISGMRNHSAADVLATIQAPVLICAGDADVFTPPRVQERMHALVPDAEILWFAEGSHMLPLDEPAAIAEGVRDFIARRVTGEVSV